MHGLFKLYYKSGAAIVPCAGVQYRVLTTGNKILVEGVTDASGLTRGVLMGATSQELRLELQEAPGKYVTPDYVQDKSDLPAMHLPANSPNTSFHMRNVQLKPYVQARFLSSARQPIPNATFKAYARDPQGKLALAVDKTSNKPLTGTTDANGCTPKLGYSEALVVQFQIPSTTLKVNSESLAPGVQGQHAMLHDVPLKSVTSITAPNPNHTAVATGKTSLPVLISPEEEELIMVTQEEFDQFEKVSGKLDSVIAAMHGAKLDHSKALEAGDAKTIEAAEKNLNLVQDEVKKELNGNFKKLADIKEVITLETYKKGTNAPAGASDIGLRRRYLSSDKYMQLRNKRLNKTEFKIDIKFFQKKVDAAKAAKKAAELDPVTGNAAAREEHAVRAAMAAQRKADAEFKAALNPVPKTLNTKATNDSFKKIADSLVKEYAKAEKKWKIDPKVFNLLELAGNEYANTVMKSDTYQVDTQAQWLRLVGGGGASAEASWEKKTVQLQGNLQLKAVLCEGQTTVQWAAPSLKGAMLSFAGEDLGAIRCVLELKLYGYAGAKIIASGAVGLTFEDGKQVAKGVKNAAAQKMGKTSTAPSGQLRVEAMDPYEEFPKDISGIKGEIDAFVGVEGGLTPAGKLQWLPPQAREFESFAEISATLAVSAGAGLGGVLAIYFELGRFRVRVAAKLCWGVGAKGAFEFTVAQDKLIEFAHWVSCQLLNAGVVKLLYFSQDAFMAFSRLLVVLVGRGSSYAQKIEATAQKVDTAFFDLIKDFENAKSRAAIVANILQNPKFLIYATPEARGMLLYQITRHGLASHARNPPKGEMTFDPEIHYLPKHKEAILTIMKSTVTAPAWDNTLQHMTERGKKSAESSGENEKKVLDFLNNGLFLADLPPVTNALNAGKAAPKDTGNKHLDKYLELRGKLLGSFPKGYQIACMDTEAFKTLAMAHGGPHFSFDNVQFSTAPLVFDEDSTTSTALAFNPSAPGSQLPG